MFRKSQKKVIDIKNHSVYQNQGVQKSLRHYKQEVAPHVEPSLVKKLDRTIIESLIDAAYLYNEATKSPGSKVLFKVIKEKHLKEGRTFIERESKNPETTGLKLRYVKAYAYCITDKEHYQEEFGKKEASPLFSVSRKATRYVGQAAEKPNVRFNEEKLEQVKEIPRIGNRRYHSGKVKLKSNLESASNSPSNPQAKEFSKRKESSVLEESPTSQPER